MIFLSIYLKVPSLYFHGFSFCVAITIIMTVNFMLKNNPAIICFLAYLIRRKRQQA